jgi:hypothetical protein
VNGGLDTQFVELVVEVAGEGFTHFFFTEKIRLSEFHISGRRLGRGRGRVGRGLGGVLTTGGSILLLGAEDFGECLDFFVDGGNPC